MNNILGKRTVCDRPGCYNSRLPRVFIGSDRLTNPSPVYTSALTAGGMVMDVTIVERLRGRKLTQMRSSVESIRPLCPVCEAKGVVRVGDELDHIVPLFKGGDNSYTNLQLLCFEHHRDKTNAEMGYVPKQTVGADGWPVEAGGAKQAKGNHPWQPAAPSISSTIQKTGKTL